MEQIRFGIHLGAKLAVLLTAPHVTGHVLDHGFHVPRELGPELVRSIERFAHDQPRPIRVGREEIHDLAGHRVELIFTRGRRQEDARQGLGPAREHVVEHRRAQRLLRLEVVEQGGLSHAHLFGDVAEGGALEAARSEKPGRHGQDLAVRVGRLLAPAYHAVGIYLPIGSWQAPAAAHAAFARNGFSRPRPCTARAR